MTLEQLPPPGLLVSSEQVVAGRINTTTSGTILQGSGFTITRNGTGDVTVTFATAFSEIPRVVPGVEDQPAATDVHIRLVGAPTTTTARFIIVSGAGSAIDSIFSFLAYIPSTTKTKAPRDFGLVTALPTTPTPATGDLCTYTDSLTAPTYNWQLRYNGSDTATQKWECIGGTPKLLEADTRQTSASTTYVAVPTDGLTFTTPLAGDWELSGAATIDSTAGDTTLWSYTMGTPSGTGADVWGAAQANQSFASTNPAPPHKFTSVASGTIVTEAMRVTAGAAAGVQRRHIRIMPIRVG